jgi:magnesium chelatase family protein
VASAFRSIGHPLPPKKITVNLSPAQIRKSGTAFDFPMAVAFLAAMELIPKEPLRQICVLGELGLNGQIRGAGNCLPIVLEAMNQGIHHFFVPYEDYDSLQLVKGADIIYMESLSDVISYFSGNYQNRKKNPPIVEPTEYELDFSQIRGQVHLKRAIEIAVTGRHHLLMIGSPGSGKTMALHRIPSILPELTDKEHLEVQSIYDAAGQPRAVSDPMPPFRMPHSGITKAAILGGGASLKAGEITLAHHGVLFLGETLCSGF